jgi:hypothetical protein
MKKLRVTFVMVGLLMGLVAMNITTIYQFIGMKLVKTTPIALQRRVVTESKAELVTEVNQTVLKIASLEKILGKTELQGYKVYTAQETKQLISLYQNLEIGLNYLNYGDLKMNLKQWEGYPLASQVNKPYRPDQIVKVMNDLAQCEVPGSFVTDLKIYLLPYVIPDVSGLGGPGYVILSAQAATADLIENQLPVTLYHEIGHHVNFSFMAKTTARGEKLWAQFLRIRGGTWHGPGSVNTKAWGESSEETFAEDFRMLFGKNQPYFGDLALGDPRVDSKKARNEIQFIKNLATEKNKTHYQSPWIPNEGLIFWQYQGILLIGLWMSLGIGILTCNGLLSFQVRKRSHSINS